MKTDDYIKLTSVCLSAAMVMAGMAFIPSNAADAPTIKINTISIEDIEELPILTEEVDLLDDNGNPVKDATGKNNVKVTKTYHLATMEVSLANNPGFLTGSFGIEYNEGLIYEDCTPKNAGIYFQLVDNPDEHLLWCMGAGNSTTATANTSVEEPILELTFRIPEEVTGGVFPFKFLWTGKDGSSAHWYTDKKKTDVSSQLQTNAVDGALNIHGAGALNYTSLTLNQGAQEQLTVLNAAANVYWFSSNSEVATVDSITGLVTAVGAGECDISAFIDSELQVCHVTVTAEDYYTIIENGVLTITNPNRDIYLRHPNASGGVVWVSPDPSTINIDTATGKLQIMKPGTDCEVPIFATANGKTMMCTLKITYNSDVTDTTQPTTAEPSDTTPQREILLGDVDGDGNINILDVIAINRIILGKSVPTPDELAAADYNGDGKVDATDSLKILKHLVGLD